MSRYVDDDFENDSENNSELSYEQPNGDSEGERDSSGVNGVQEGSDFFQMHGMFFCSTCKNLMQPCKTKGEILEFKCRRCGLKPISFNERKDTKSMVMCRSLQASARRTDLESKSIFDRSMPTISVECPECGYDEGVYTVVPEEGERRIVMRVICARGAEEKIVKCGHKWSLRQESEIDDNDDNGAMRIKEGSGEEDDD